MEYPHYHGEVQNGKHVDEVLRSYFPDYNYNGIFLDIGAYEPINISNSYHFEKNGWEVYCFEANTLLIDTLKSQRKNVYNYAISYEDKENITFNVVKGCWGGGSLMAGLSAIELDPQYLEVFHDGIQEVLQINVPQKKINTVLEEEIFVNTLDETKYIDIISIDVEGGELNVLKGIDLVKYKPKLFVIENVFNNRNIPDYLEPFGYCLDQTIDYNQYYILRS